MKKILIVVFCLFLFSCTSNEDEIQIENISKPNTSKTTSNTSIISTTIKVWDFNDLIGWEDATQAGVPNYWIENGNLHILTNPNTWDRTKIKTTSTFTNGTYSWRVYVPEMGIGDMASIGAFIYNNDTHELDFEIGYGKQSERNLLNAQFDDVMVYMTSQSNPFISYKKLIKRNNWYDLSIDLKLNAKKKYYVTWRINNVIAGGEQLTYGTTYKFKMYCSVENLKFIGDHIPNSQNYALFDSAGFKSN